MFERNRVDNSLQTATVAAELTLKSGEFVKGKFVINSSRTLADVLNGEAQFLEFETYEGARSLISKSTIAAIRITPAPAAASLQSRARELDTFDPHAILGLRQGASWDDVRQAYLALSKSYHPDKFSGVALPSEVRDYLSAMARRINAAYQALESPQLAARAISAEKSKPIFTSAQRG